ncbi:MULTISPECIES: conjugal transfer protein TraH [Asticcacaulis]|jgi:conjugative transfer pilus assembly protein TraH|uniref:conjugal transfer protein TraH n=1 Tax=Asticcacaulis TaxID=76890 RepID=UPI001AE52C5A|nr:MULTISPECIES: conjugal transfer protein TraH [Asticcacaulis]MBP2160579.1 conjugative transfer pilus assembly protein TraH [Asticcacaulis solisilvae]MDR6801624.1 conjugative transfer pilus assembly protein TraH [Asticcacaulis sp. BE141]
MSKRSGALFCLGLALVTAVPARANVDGAMDNFWNDAMSATNGSGPSVYQGQAAGYYTLGNFSYRAPQMNTQVASVGMPSVKSGCGGIDIYGGSFSFINSDQIVASMKAIAQNALGLLFQMAVDSLSELLGSNMKDAFKKMQDLNGVNINSCEAAQNLVAGTVNRIQAAQSKACTEVGTTSGLFSDWAKAKEQCGAGGQAETTAASAPAATRPVNRNVAWEAIQKHPLFKSDTELALTMMTLTGSVVITAESGAPPSVLVIPAAAKNDGMITKLLDGGTFRVHECANTECTRVNQFAREITLEPSKSIKKRVSGMLLSIVNKIRTRSALTEEEKSFLGLVSLPVYKMASVQVAYQGNFASIEMDRYSDVVALDLVLTWMSQNMEEMTNASQNLAGVDEQLLLQWQDNVQATRQELFHRQSLVQDRIVAMESIIAKTREVEKIIFAEGNSRIAQSLMFSSTFKN